MVRTTILQRQPLLLMGQCSCSLTQHRGLLRGVLSQSRQMRRFQTYQRPDAPPPEDDPPPNDPPEEEER